MLPSLGFQEILLLGILALVVVGPKDLPLLLRKLGRWTAKLRAMAQEFRSGFDELARQAELDELKKEVDALRRNQVLSDLNHEITKPLAAPPEMTLPPPHDVMHGAAGAAEVVDESPAPQISANGENGGGDASGGDGEAASTVAPTPRTDSAPEAAKLESAP